jgi:uncharacterized protein (TIGR02186 family)
MRVPLLALVSLGLAAAPARASAAPPRAAAAEQGLLVVEPEEVGVDLFFAGATLHVRGAIPAGHDDAAVLCAGNETALSLRRKGRVWGVLWMNTSEVAFDRVPAVYVLHTSVPLARLGSAALLERLGVGFDGLEARTGFDGPAGERRAVFDELVRLKKREGLFSLGEGAAMLGRGARGEVEVSTDVFLPARTPPGDYRITLFSFHGGEGGTVAETAVAVQQVGLAAFTSRTARERGLLYGVFAVLVAIAAGMATGFVFGRGPRGPH